MYRHDKNAVKPISCSLCFVPYAFDIVSPSSMPLPLPLIHYPNKIFLKNLPVIMATIFLQVEQPVHVYSPQKLHALIVGPGQIFFALCTDVHAHAGWSTSCW